MIETLVFVLLVAGFGLIARRWLTFAPHSGPGRGVLVWALAATFSLGASSCTLFVAGVMADGLGPGARWLELAALALLASVAWLAVRRLPASPPGASSQPLRTSGITRNPRLLGLLLSISFAIAAALALAQLFELTRERPHGEWDAWAIWNGRASFLAQLTHDWPAGALAISHGHGGYPMLLSLSVARFWAYLGTANLLVPQVFAAFYLLSLVAVLVSALSSLRSLNQGLLAGLVLLAAPAGVELTSYLYADLPFSFYLLAVCVLLVASDRAPTRERTRLLAAAGLAMGLAAWTKNEGLALALIAVSAFGITTLRASPATALRDLRALLTGLLPIACVIASFELGWAPGNDLITRFQLERVLGHLSDPTRLSAVAQAYGYELRQLAGGLAWALPVYGLLAGTRVRAQRGVGASTALLSVVGLGALTFIVYVTTPHDLDWHLSTSCRRVLFQLFPSCVFLLFLGLATPEEATGKAAS